MNEAETDATISKDNNKIFKSFISGGLAGMIGKTMVAPLERIKYLFVVRFPV